MLLNESKSYRPWEDDQHFSYCHVQIIVSMSPGVNKIHCCSLSLLQLFHTMKYIDWNNPNFARNTKNILLPIARYQHRQYLFSVVRTECCLRQTCNQVWLTSALTKPRIKHSQLSKTTSKIRIIRDIYN